MTQNKKLTKKEKTSDNSEKQATHSTTHSLAIAQNVEFVDELVKIVARFCDRRQIGLKQYIVVLL